MNIEQLKYELLWGEHSAYRNVAPGEQLADAFLSLANPKPDQVCYDFGCGTGRGAARISQRCKVVGFDFAANCLDPLVKGLFEFKQHDLTQPIDSIADFGFCTDVLEHVPTEDVRMVLLNIISAARRCYLAISTVDDVMGGLIGSPLHLTVKPMDWWKGQLESLGFKIEDSQETDSSCVFWGSAFADLAELEARSVLNVDDERIKSNILSNLRLGLQEIAPHQIQEDTVIYLLAGGPSLVDHEDEIVELGRDGALFVTVNGTYNWLIERGIRPAAQVMVDARPFNARFVEPLIDTCRYLFSSQAAHEAVVKVPPEQAWLYHSGDNATVRACFDEFCAETGTEREWWPVYGGTTVIGRALTLLAMLGFRKIEVFGWDSCLRGEQHHAYDQPENDGQRVIDVNYGGRQFKCHPWMAIQANEVQTLVRFIYAHIDGFVLNVRGDGLIAHIFNHAAELAETE